MTVVNSMIMGGTGVFALLFVVTLTNVVTSYVSPSGSTMNEIVGRVTGLDTTEVL
jgi:hypothetical protein